MFSRDELQKKVTELLKQAGISLAEAARNPAGLECAADIVSERLPGGEFVWRERVKGALLQLVERLPATSDSPGRDQARAVESRLLALREEIRQAFGDKFGTKRSLRGYNADADLLCTRLVNACEALEAMIPQADILCRVRLLLAKAQVYANWQKLQGSKANQRSASTIYEMAWTLARDDNQLKAEISYQHGLFCAATDESVGGGKERAIEQFQKAASTAAPGSSLRIASETEMTRLQTKRWLF